jgi:hypothetical protein
MSNIHEASGVDLDNYDRTDSDQVNHDDREVEMFNAKDEFSHHNERREKLGFTNR